MAFCTKRPDANVATGHQATRNDSGSLTQIMTGAVTDETVFETGTLGDAYEALVRIVNSHGK